MRSENSSEMENRIHRENCHSCSRRKICRHHVKKNRFEGAREMAGAMSHELNQVLQQFMGYSELMAMEVERLGAIMDLRPLMAGNREEFSEMETEILLNVKELTSKLIKASEKMGEFTFRISKLNNYRTKEYLPGRIIIDIEGSSKREETAPLICLRTAPDPDLGTISLYTQGICCG
ncbi:MAG: hypothetical protein CVV64_20110 [Candidatus Wallbacteria bacterium HGW-Wallbacteria-1]|uniref:Signal transduction histidine kinase dimerisation/phosphoacceptor domain-containing protein n=1 Tax=Candidatus Wallbacteria bacterium HGW-Wallbacteria-1 TaxID=2013854 RepID=A0A2N1PIF7_9BACT|nr:MAG: hypothetical protein CVV64_20110 [Candidatus Wallbacteria bacterium HGW-Wallbacteria-1]